jgi:hypothetical protein
VNFQTLTPFFFDVAVAGTGTALVAFDLVRAGVGDAEVARGVGDGSVSAGWGAWVDSTAACATGLSEF